MQKVVILFLSANPWTTSRILVDEEGREIFETLEEGTYRDRFEIVRHAAIKAGDLQRLLLKYEPHIVHFSGHGSLTHKLILEGTRGKGKQLYPAGLVDVFRLYSDHVRLVLLNACFTKGQAQALAKVIDYSVGISKGIGDRAGVTFAGAFYRALGFGKSVQWAFASAKAELRLTNTPRSSGIELFVRDQTRDTDVFPSVKTRRLNRCGCASLGSSRRLLVGRANKDKAISGAGETIVTPNSRHADVDTIRFASPVRRKGSVSGDCGARTLNRRRKQMSLKTAKKSSMDARGLIAASPRKPTRKALGTRVGTVEDWRASGRNPAKASGPRGKGLRDGR